MGKRRKFSRWRRLPGAYRIGDDKPPERSGDLERLSLFINGDTYDRAEEQASRLGFPSAVDYCTDVVVKAVETEHVRSHVADVESKRGPLEGLHEIADDPEYLADLRSAVAPARPEPPRAEPPRPRDLAIRYLDESQPTEPPDALVEDVAARPPRPAAPRELSPAALVVLRHAGQFGDDGRGFLPTLRRGAQPPSSQVAELSQALADLERECRDDDAMDRRLTFALHRLAFESQVLHTDAWPGAFDVWTVDTLRSVQEGVERILSGQDIRYYPVPSVEGPR